MGRKHVLEKTVDIVQVVSYVKWKNTRMKNIKIITVACLMAGIDLSLAALEYFLLREFHSLYWAIFLALALILVFFLLRPIVEAVYEQQIRSLIETEMPKRRAECLESFVETVNDHYYSEDYLDAMHLRKNAINRWQSCISSKYEIIKIAVHTASYAAVFLFMFSQYFVPVFLLVLFSIFFKYKLEQKQVDQYLSNVHEDKVAEYYRKILFDPEPMHDIKIYGGEGKLVEQSVRAFEIGLKKRYRLRHVNAVAYPLLKTIVLAVEVGAFILLLGKQHVNLSQIVLGMSCVFAAISHTDPLCEAIFDYKESKAVLDEYEKSSLLVKHYQRDGICLDHIEEIRFEHVSFEYQEGQEILQDISFTWDTRSSISLIGDNGSGKTTLVKLLLGLNHPTSGTIFVNGHPLSCLNLSSYLACFGVCLQDYVIFEDELWNNLTFGKNEAAMGKLWAPARSKLLDFVDKLPEGLHTHLGRRVAADGVELSVGQEQRLALCRAITKDVKLYVLDEPSAALDPEIEQQYFHIFQTLTSECPSFLVTHRLGFASLSDRILVLKNGRLLEEGSHKELMKLRGCYYQMFHTQSQMYENGESMALELT